MAKTTDAEFDLRILRTIADDHRTPADVKKALKKDVRSRLTALKKDGSVEIEDGQLRLTKRGAGRLRFAG